jgi:two-component system sensor histidine kinase VicK
MDEDRLARSSSADISPVELRAALEKIMRESLRPYAAGLGLLYVIFAVSHALLAPRDIAVPLESVAAGTAAVLFALYGILRKWTVPIRWVHPIGVGVAGLVLLNSVLHLYLTSEPQQTTNLMLLVIGVGFFLLSTPWFALVLGLIWVGWGGVVWMADPSPSWVHFGFGLLSASMLSVLVFTVRVRSFRRLEILRIQDEHRRKELEEAVQEARQSEQRYRNLVDTARDVIFTLSPDGTLASLNPAFETITGWPRAQWLGKPFTPLLHPDDVPFALKLFQRAVQGETLSLFELRIISQSGEPLFGEFTATPQIEGGTTVGILGIARDISERKRAEETRLRAELAEAAKQDLEREIAERIRAENALRQSEERYRELFENANDAIVITTLDGTIIDINRAFETMVGRSREELIGQNYTQFVTPKAAVQAEEHTRRALDGDDCSEIFESAFVRKDGSIVPVESRTRLIRDQDGQPIGLQGISRDISTRKALEQQRADFLAMLTHDIRSPLGVILGYTDLLLEAVQEEDFAEEKDLLLRLKNNVLTVHSLLANYLDLSRIEAGQLALFPAPVAINDLLRRVSQQYEAETQHKFLTFTLELQAEIPLVQGDPLALERIFANLLLNAFKFTPEGGQVTVRSALHNDEEVVVVVADSGPGIAPEEIPLIFEKYRRSERAQFQVGTGLGLFIVKTLVEAQGGRIEVQSTPGQGARFFVFLPVASLSSPAAL